MESFDVDYFGTYDKDGNFIVENITEKISGTQIISKSVLPHIFKERLTKFYYKIPEGILEIHAATIHSYSDLEKTKTEPEGYFIVAKLLDSLYLKNIENISSSKISLVNSNILDQPSELHVIKVINLKNEKDEIINKLTFKRPFTSNFQNSKYILLFIISFFFINLLASILIFKKIIYIPLNLITRILKNNSTIAIKKLKKHKGEFGYIGNLFSVSEKQKADLKEALEKVKESDKLKSIFLTNLSHEIRTPMNAIIGFTDLIADENIDNAKKNKFIGIVKKSGYNLVSIINDLIEMSRIDAELIAPNYSSFNLDEFLLDIKNTLQITIPKDKSLTIELTQPHKTINAYFNSDQIKLKQILSNLLTNAIKFTEKGIIKFGYELSTDKSKIIFNVKDTGNGIDKEYQKNIFDRFMRVQSDKIVNVTGLGLGLAI